MKKYHTVIASLTAILGLVLVAPPADARSDTSSSPDVHVTRVDRVCGNDVTVYEFRLESLGDQPRGVRGRIVWKGQGYSESFSRRVGADWRTIERVRLAPGERATVTFRTQGQVIMRSAMVGDCHTKADTV